MNGARQNFHQTEPHPAPNQPTGFGFVSEKLDSTLSTIENPVLTSIPLNFLMPKVEYDVSVI